MLETLVPNKPEKIHFKLASGHNQPCSDRDVVIEAPVVV